MALNNFDMSVYFKGIMCIERLHGSARGGQVRRHRDHQATAQRQAHQRGFTWKERINGTTRCHTL